MSSKKAIREVQLDIERTVKKVIEGVDIFEQIFEKIQTTTNPAQKDKLQGDLKREIKKLQRQRDEIKVWIGMNEIKDKSVLLEYRKIIEQEMEKFKACEKELKTKAFSKEGLQKQVVMDPEEQERDNMRTWITDAVDKLNTNMEILDAELETLSAKKKGKIDKAKEPRLIHVKFRIDRHKFHVNRLELVLRLLDNCSLEVAAVSSIQDSVDYYVSNFDDPDFDDDVANEYYVDLNLDEVAGFGTPHDDLGGDNDEDEGIIF